MVKYVLPELDYDYGALAPHIAPRIMELHHGKHHAAYVTNANKALEQLAEVKESDPGRIAALERALAFNVSGHVLHSLFWKNLSPKGGGQPTGALLAALEKDFSSFDRFRMLFDGAAAGIMGSGWAVLAFDPTSRRLLVTQTYDHQSNIAHGAVPLMVADAWEHAFYLQYENRKTEFFAALWNIWNWSDIAARFDAAQKLDLALPRAVAE